MPKKIYVIAGEASGDLHGANLIERLKEADPSLELYGVGGDRIRRTGVQRFFDLAHFHVTGVTDALLKIPQYRRAAEQILRDIREVRPDLVVLIDNPGFNLHLAKKIHAMDIRIAYYIAPQVWAWGQGRVLKIKRLIKKVFVVFEFEKQFFEQHGVDVEWVGHPLKERMQQTLQTESRNAERASEGPTVALMPGSRKGELESLFGVFAEAAKVIGRQVPKVRFVLIKAGTLDRPFYDRLMQKHGLRCPVIEEGSYEAIRSSALVLVCSGTATLECALLGTPMIIAYRAGFVTYLAARIVIKVPFLGLPNLILGKRAVPEYLQYEATPEKIASEAVRILKDDSVSSGIRTELAQVSSHLGTGDASKRTADGLLRLLV